MDRRPGQLQLSIKLVNNSRRVTAVSFHWPTFSVFIKGYKHLCELGIKQRDGRLVYLHVALAIECLSINTPPHRLPEF